MRREPVLFVQSEHCVGEKTAHLCDVTNAGSTAFHCVIQDVAPVWVDRRGVWAIGFDLPPGDVAVEGDANQLGLARGSKLKNNDRISLLFISPSKLKNNHRTSRLHINLLLILIKKKII